MSALHASANNTPVADTLPSTNPTSKLSLIQPKTQKLKEAQERAKNQPLPHRSATVDSPFPDTRTPHIIKREQQKRKNEALEAQNKKDKKPTPIWAYIVAYSLIAIYIIRFIRKLIVRR